ncbi:MAG TPA: hypothetical protein PLO89_07855, partial [Spirochaetota bacterium]|nr:hypothetical protein [Spirochaetota bacterium]
MLKKIRLSIFLIISLFSTISLFSDGKFHDTIIDFKNEVVDFSETGLMDNIRGGELVNLSPLDLQIGDIFIDVDGIAKKVAS